MEINKSDVMSQCMPGLRSTGTTTLPCQGTLYHLDNELESAPIHRVFINIIISLQLCPLQGSKHLQPVVLRRLQAMPDAHCQAAHLKHAEYAA